MVEVFEYKGTPVFRLEPVTSITDYDEQIAEIYDRLEAMYHFCQDHGYLFTPVHMQNALAIDDNTYKRMRGAKGQKSVALRDGKRKQESAPIEMLPSKSDEEVAFAYRRSALIKQWEKVANQACLDKCSTDTIPTRTIYLSKSIFHNWDTPQQENSNQVSIELLLGRAFRAKLKDENNGK